MSTLVLKRTYYSERLRKIAIAVVALILVFAIFTFFRRGSQPANATTYEFGEVSRGTIRSSVTATGVIQPWKTVDIKSNVAGRIERMYVDLGDEVKVGDPIMDIDPTDTQVAVDQAQADLNAALARKSQAELNAGQEATQARARVNSALRSLEAARARLAQAQANRKVQPQLTQSAINQARASLSAAQKSLAQTRQSRAQLQEQLKQLRSVTIPLNEQTIRSNVNQAKANLDSAQADYNRQAALLKKGYVSKGEVETSYAQLASAQATHATAQQRLNTLQQENQIAISELSSRIAEAQSRIEQSAAQVQQAQAALKTAQANTFQNDVRGFEVSSAQAAVKQAEADLTSARAQMNQIAVRQREVTAANAQIVRGEASLKQASTNLGFTKILAPRAGVIITKNVEEGTVVPSSRGSIGSTDALFQIGDTSRLWIVTLVDETDIGQVERGQRVEVQVDAFPTETVTGMVIRVDPQAKIEQNVTMIPVTVEIAKPDDRFKPGMSAECEFIVEEAKNVLMVPNEAIREDDGKFTVQKMVGDKPKDFPVTVGLAGPDATEIKSGLREGEKVVTEIIEPETSEPNNPFERKRPDRKKDKKKGGSKGG